VGPHDGRRGGGGGAKSVAPTGIRIPTCPARGSVAVSNTMYQAAHTNARSNRKTQEYGKATLHCKRAQEDNVRMDVRTIVLR
jgi:hypothetical protein